MSTWTCHVCDWTTNADTSDQCKICMEKRRSKRKTEPKRREFSNYRRHSPKNPFKMSTWTCHVCTWSTNPDTSDQCTMCMSLSTTPLPPLQKPSKPSLMDHQSATRQNKQIVRSTPSPHQSLSRSSPDSHLGDINGRC